MAWFLYNALLKTAAPLGKWWLRTKPQYQPLLERFDPEVPSMDGAPIWIQACSVGEVNTAMPLIEALQTTLPDIPILLTTSTVTGHTLASEKCRSVYRSWFPFDHPTSVKHFLEQVRPRILVLVETEIWPNVLRETKRFGTPVLVVNGRLSDKHMPKYQRFKPVFKSVLSNITRVGVQNQEFARRFCQLGLPEEKVVVTGNTKFDAVQTAVPAKERSRLRRVCGIPADSPVLIFGSTRPGDEALASACWSRLREELPDLRLIIALRHVQRAQEASACFDEPVLLRSQLKQGKHSTGERIVLVDTLGELLSFYALADLAVVGGSFYPGVNGHNPLEPAALGVPTVFGPYMANFQEPAVRLLEAKGARQVPCPEDLYEVLSDLLQNPAERRQMGTRARRAVLAAQGAIQRNVALICQTLGM